MTELTRCERTADPLASQRARRITSRNLRQGHTRIFARAPHNQTGQLVQRQVDLWQRSLHSATGYPRQAATDTRRRMYRMRNKERVSRRLVASTPDDPRFGKTFQAATSIFSTNDIKYHVNKVRARQWADAASVPLHYAIARDMASSTVLQEKPEAQRSKIEWLQRHDQECGGLYGILPICLTLPVRATEHLDRRRGILKGCKGKIIGWSAAPDTQIWNKLPRGDLCSI